jgi:predicted MPP superfamily phosphohydrolase
MPGYELVGCVIFATLSVLPAAIVVNVLFMIVRSWKVDDPTLRRKRLKRLALSSVCVLALYSVVVIDAFMIEPNYPKIERVELTGAVSAPIKILHISDLHIEPKLQPREQWLMTQIKAVNPDLILLTGDVHQMDNMEVENVRQVLDAVRAPLGVFACVGYDNLELMRTAAPHIKFLANANVSLKWGDKTIGVAGLLPIGDRKQVYEAIASDGYRIVMNHTPDLADEAASHGANLYLGGHTHGGQVRIPLWGAIITNCKTGKKYEGGLYRIGGMTARISRGLGLEPPPAPPVRFFCRPEAGIITVSPL